MSDGSVDLFGWFRRGKGFVWERYLSLRPNQRCYVNAIALFALYPLIRPWAEEASQGVWTLACFFWIAAASIDVATSYHRLADTTLGKLLVLAVVGIGANTAIALAAKVVNDVIGLDPGKYVHTIAYVSLFMVPLLASVVAGAILVLAIGLGFFYFLFQITGDRNAMAVVFPWVPESEDRPFGRITLIIQVVSFFALYMYATTWFKEIQPSYESFVKDQARWFLYNVEMFERAPCQLSSDQRVSFLDANQVLVAYKEGEAISFKVQGCEAGL